MAKTFLLITTVFSFLPPITFGLNNIIRAQGNPHIAMSTLIAGAILNVIFNPIFVGLFHWGVAGSAWATVLSQAITSIWVILFFCGHRSLLKLRLRYFPLKWELCWPMLLVGLAPFLTQSVSCLQGMLLMGQLTHYGGDPALTVWGVVHRSAMVIFSVVIGIYQGAQPIIGYNYGAFQYDRVLEALRKAIFLATCWCVGVVALVVLFPEQLLQVFTPMTPELKVIAATAIRWALISLILLGFQVISSHYFQAVGKPRLAIFLSMTRQIIFLIPLLLILPRVIVHFGFEPVYGVWLVFPISDTLAFLLTAVFYFREVRELKTGNVRLSRIAAQMEDI